jgi:signal transduction histidine kinase
MAGIAVGVLVVTGVTTVGLARNAAERNAVRHLEQQAPAVQNQLQRLVADLRVRTAAGEPGVAIGRLITSVLRLTGGTVLSVDDDGTITEGVEALAGGRLGADIPVADRRARLGAGVRRRLGPAAGLLDRSANQLPAGLSVDDFDADRLRAGETQTGAVGDRAFIAVPMRGQRGTTSVLVLTESIDASAISRARGFFLVGAALALIVAGVVSYVLARRLTRPLAVMGATAGAIAGGDLSARVDLGDHPDDEFADLADSLNRMAVGLQSVRENERQFLLSVSHDLRTPLTSIRGYADALTDGTIPATEEQRRAGAVIAAESDRLARLVADLLDLARLDAHQFSLAPRRFDLAPEVRTTVDAFRPAAADLGIDLTVDAPESLTVVGDPGRVAQILANLVENALKYARAAIRVEVRAGDEDRVELRVQDDGPGVDPAEVHRVFERLFVSRSVPGRSVGTGLGLAIVGELSAAMGGRASIAPGAGGGATFVVQLPRQVATD